MTRPRLGPWLVALATLSVAIATALFTLHWSPYPATLDGLGHARIARDTLASGGLPVDGLRADNLVPPTALAMTAALVGIPPVRLAQPLFGLVGATVTLFGVLFAVRLARSAGWTPRRVRAAATVAGLGLAVDGLFVRRFGVPDSDAFTLVFVPLVALALFRYARRGRRAWLAAALPVLVAFPITHTFSTLVAALSLLALAAVLVVTGRTRNRGRALVAAGVVAGFWAYFSAYYELAPLFSMTVPYVDRVSAHPGLFVAWSVVLLVGVVWYRQAGRRVRWALFCSPFALFFLVVGLNTVVTVYPGTASTPRLVLLLVSPLAIPVAVAAVAAPVLGRRGSVGAVLLALGAAPVVNVLFALTASLTPEFAATAMRAQTFVHLPVFVLAGAGTVTVVDWLGRSLETGSVRRLLLPAVVVLLVAALATLPLAYVTLDTAAFPKGTHSSEFEAAAFVAGHATGGWTSDHKGTRVAGNYFPTSGTVGPTRAWLAGAPPPDCTLVAERSWTTTGAHLFPAAPRTVSPERYERAHTRRNVVYTSAGLSAITVSVPNEGGGEPGC